MKLFPCIILFLLPLYIRGQDTVTSYVNPYCGYCDCTKVVTFNSTDDYLRIIGEYLFKKNDGYSDAFYLQIFPDSTFEFYKVTTSIRQHYSYLEGTIRVSSDTVSFLIKEIIDVGIPSTLKIKYKIDKQKLVKIEGDHELLKKWYKYKDPSSR